MQFINLMDKKNKKSHNNNVAAFFISNIEN